MAPIFFVTCGECDTRFPVHLSVYEMGPHTGVICPRCLTGFPWGQAKEVATPFSGGAASAPGGMGGHSHGGTGGHAH